MLAKEAVQTLARKRKQHLIYKINGRGRSFYVQQKRADGSLVDSQHSRYFAAVCGGRYAGLQLRNLFGVRVEDLLRRSVRRDNSRLPALIVDSDSGEIISHLAHLRNGSVFFGDPQLGHGDNSRLDPSRHFTRDAPARWIEPSLPQGTRGSPRAASPPRAPLPKYKAHPGARESRGFRAAAREFPQPFARAGPCLANSPQSAATPGAHVRLRPGGPSTFRSLPAARRPSRHIARKGPCCTPNACAGQLPRRSPARSRDGSKFPPTAGRCREQPARLRPLRGFARASGWPCPIPWT